MRDFITSPLERVIAAADGIDYLESPRAHSAFTPSPRAFRLNYDSTKALAEISSKVDQVRNNLPEAEVPVINIESADSRFASAYLSFSSDLLQQNEITDFLVHVVQPGLLSAAGGAAATSSAPAPRSSPTGWGLPEHQPGPGAPGACRQQLPGRPGAGARGIHPGQPHCRRETSTR